jgi:hypothetical protein
LRHKINISGHPEPADPNSLQIRENTGISSTTTKCPGTSNLQKKNSCVDTFSPANPDSRRPKALIVDDNPDDLFT